MIATEQLTIRHYIPGDIMRHLVLEYAQMEITPELCWVAEGPTGEIVAVVMVAAGHQTATFLRIAALPGAPPNWLLNMMRYVIKDLTEHGYIVAISCLSATRAEELKLARMFGRAGGKLTAIAGYIGALPLIQAGRW